MDRFRGLAKLMVRPWFKVLWWVGYFIAIMIVQVAVGLLWPMQTYSFEYWVRSFVIATPIWIFFNYGFTLRHRGREYLRRQRVDNLDYES